MQAQEKKDEGYTPDMSIGVHLGVQDPTSKHFGIVLRINSKIEAR